MRRSVSSVLNQAEDLEIAVNADPSIDLLVTQTGRFQAHVTYVTLHSLRLIEVREELGRIASLTAPEHAALIALSFDVDRPAIWWGKQVRPDDIVTIGARCSVRTRTDGPSHWGLILVPEQELARFGRALTGRALPAIQHACVWRPRPCVRRELDCLHATATAHIWPTPLTSPEAVHGLEQELMHALIECLSGKPAWRYTTGSRRQTEILDRFDSHLSGGSQKSDVSAICKALGVSGRLLRGISQNQLGLSPLQYAKRHRLRSVYRVLRQASPGEISVAEAARRYGFRSLGRFAAAYRNQFQENPSVTLRSGAGQFLPRLEASGQPKSLR